MGCQKGIAKAIVDKGADYIFSLKGNQPNLHREVLDAFDAETCAMLAQELESYAETVDKGHGRSEVRRVWLQRMSRGSLRRRSGTAWRRWCWSKRSERGVTSCERQAYISSLTVSATKLGAKVRGHWHVGQAPR